MDYATAIDQALKQFYAQGNNDVHAWLLQVQASREAWTFAWELLDPSKSQEVQFFAATTLHTKISKQWGEVPKNEYPALRERLLNSIKHLNAPKFILSKLCQALAAFMANVTADDTEERGKTVVEELMEVLSYDSLPKLELLLCTLSVLPGEFERRYKARRSKLYKHVGNGWFKTAWLLEQVFSMCNPNNPASDNVLHQLAMECTLSWLKSEELPTEATGQIYPHLLVAAAYYAPSRDAPNEENSRGWDIIQECLKIILTSSEIATLPQTLWNWVHSLVTMARQYSGKYFCEVLTAVGETHSREFMLGLISDNETKKWTSEGLIELLLQCSEQEGRYPTDERRSSIPFGFWYSLQDDLTFLDQPYESRALMVLKPIYARLVQALLRKSTLPSSPSEAGDADERELFRCYRQDVADTLNYCYRVLRQDLLVLFGQRLSQALDGSEKWTHVESTLHAFEAVADGSIEETQYIPSLMNLVLTRIPYDHYPGEVLGCACSTIAAYAEWIGTYPDPWLEKALRIVTLGLTRGPVIASLAIMALKDLTRECEQHMAPFAPSILTTIEQMLLNVTPGDPEGLRLMSAAGKLLNTLPTVEDRLTHLEATLGLCIVKIRELLEQPLFTSQVAVINQFKMITKFFSTLDGSIGTSVLDGLLPVFNQIVSHPEWSQDNDTLGGMYVCAEGSLVSLLHPKVDAQPLLAILTVSYKNWPHPAALDLFQQLVILFGRDPDNMITPVFAELSSVTLSGVRACKSVHGNLSDWAELLEAYLLLLCQICKKNAGMLLQVPDQIPEMLQCGMDCLTLPETGPIKAAGWFLKHAIMQSPHLKTFIQPIGQDLVCIIIRCVGGDVSRNNLEPYADVLLALNKMCLNWMVEWVRVALEMHAAQFTVTHEQKEVFIKQITRGRIFKQRMFDVLRDFSLQNLVSANYPNVTPC
ncbi:importin-13-like protein cdm [Andrena cerasifolii]|uniref:importin-13-like protein cdm n=1 Tax=Andrena cerasifolii TaxID=2819439 RepID=UPI0040379ADF